MKKFKFSLDTVLSYKQQVLEALQGEHALALAAVRAQEELLEDLWQGYRDYNAEYRQRAEEGLPLTEALMYQNGLRAAEQEIFTLAELEHRMRQIDRNRAKKHEPTASIPWGAKEGYDLCINTSGREIKTLIPALAAYCQAVGKD